MLSADQMRNTGSSPALTIRPNYLGLGSSPLVNTATQQASHAKLLAGLSCESNQANAREQWLHVSAISFGGSICFWEAVYGLLY
jgi:hypothetical protein